MADEPRRSGRATKGQHTRKDSPEPPPPKQAKQKSTKKKAKEEEEEEDAQEEVIRCVCGTETEMAYVCCDKCDAWQHIECMGLDPDLNWEKKKYYCEQCAPQNHKELLAQIERGEKPWDKLFDNEKKKKGGKKGAAKKARKSEEPSTIKPEVPLPVQEPEQPVPQQEAEVRNGAEEDAKDKAKLPESGSQAKRKRQSSTRESIGHDEKRHKSVPPEDEPSDQALDINALPADRKKLVDSLGKQIAPQLRKEVKEGKHRVPDNQTEASYCTRIALEIDHALVKNQGALDGKESPYFKQFSAIQFNIKKNTALLEGVLSGSISKDQLAKMTSEEMAPEERQRENAAMREAAEKQAMLVHEEGPRMRKTHKGDEVIEDDTIQTEDPSYIAPIGRAPAEQLGSPTTESNGANGHPLKVDTSGTPQSAGRQPSTGGFNIQQVWSSVGSPDHEHQRRASEHLRRQSSVTVPPPSAGPGDDADVDRLLKDEDDAFTPADYSSDPTISWHGVLRMPAVADFTTVGRHVAGGDVGQIIPWSQLMSRDPEIRGRIDIKRATEYISSLRGSGTDSTNIGVLSLTPVDDKNREEMSKICSYFLQRDRWGVVSEADRKHSAVRDIYVVPVQAGAMHLPEFIEMLEYCTIEQPITQDMLLLTIIARTVSPHVSAENTPAQPPASMTPSHSSTAPPVSQITPHPVPQFSPVVPQSASAGHFGSPFPPPAQNSPLPQQHQLANQAATILGPHMGSPVAQQLLATNPSIEILTNLRSILDEVPEARTDMMVLTNHLRNRNDGTQLPR